MKNQSKKLVALIAVLVFLAGLLFALTSMAAPDGGTAAEKRRRATATPTAQADDSGALPTPSPVPEGPIIEPQAIADWLFSHDMTLPENFITKRQARDLGWDSSYNYVSDVAPGKSIGGDRFGNYEELLPTARGRQYYECDCYYTGGRRSAYRVVYSNDGLVYYTEDHYQTFTQLFPSVPAQTSSP